MLILEKKLVTLLHAISLIVLSSTQLLAVESKMPFAPGEKLVYELKWTVIPAGEAILKVMPVKSINGIKSYHFVLTAKSNAFVDKIYKVRDRIDSYADIEMNGSILYKKKQREGNYKRDILVRFDQSKQKAHYSKFGKFQKTIDITEGTFDPLGAFYYTRFFQLHTKANIESHVTDGKKLIVGKAKVIRRETVSLQSGVYDTFLLEPDLQNIGGVFKKSKNAKIQLWVTADHRRIPVKIKSKVIVGSFVGELISAEGLN